MYHDYVCDSTISYQSYSKPKLTGFDEQSEYHQIHAKNY